MQNRYSMKRLNGYTIKTLTLTIMKHLVRKTVMMALFAIAMTSFIACGGGDDDDSPKETKPYIELTSAVSEITLTMSAKEEDKAGVWIDLNGNHTEDAGEKVVFSDTPEPEPVTYTKTVNTIRIYGVVESIRCNDNQLTDLDVSRSVALGFLVCHNNELTSIDISKNKVMYGFSCRNNKLTDLKVSSDNTMLSNLDCGNNQLSSLNVSELKKLSDLRCDTNKLTSLDISKNTELTAVYCQSNKITDLDISKNMELKIVACYDNPLSGLDISNNEKMLSVYSNLACIKASQAQIDKSNTVGYTGRPDLSVETKEIKGRDNRKALKLTCD